MEGFANLHTPAESAQRGDLPRPVASAAWHALFWLVFANAIGVLLAVLLLAPSLDPLLGEWTYGRWMMVHMNLELYGWASLPLVGFLFRYFGADRGGSAVWCRPVLWVWSAALAVGTLSWLSGHSSGKLFLDWSGYARVLFPVSLIALWLLLVFASVAGRREQIGMLAKVAKIVALLVLFAVPFLIYAKSGSDAYPSVNPDTGGPTGTSQLESSLAIVALLLMIPFGITGRVASKTRIVIVSWIALAAETLLCILMNQGDISHHLPAQYLSLASLLLWLPLVPAYFSAFHWRTETRMWRNALMVWWSALVITGWLLFLPGVLDRFKFTDGLVGHSFVAMAGFASSLLIFVMVQMLGEGGWIFNSPRSFWMWNVSVAAYAVLMTIAGYFEASDPAFTIVPGTARNLLYTLRLITGLAMLIASVEWLRDATKLLNERVSATAEDHVESMA